MQLTQAQIEAYHRDGYVAIPDVFTREEVAVLNKALDEFIVSDRPEIHMQRRGTEAPRLI